MTTLQRVCDFFHINITPILERKSRLPIEIPNTGRDQLADCFGAIGLKEGAEIGVERGNYSEQLCQRNPGLHLHCVDAWAAYAGYREHVSQEKLDDFFTSTQARLAAHHVTFHRGFSVPVANDFADNSLDFVYVDAAHDLINVINDLHAWIPKVRPGGIVSGHDYCLRSSKDGRGAVPVHVVEAVTAWTQSYHIYPWFVLGTKAILDNEVRDRPRSWFWIK